MLKEINQNMAMDVSISSPEATTTTSSNRLAIHQTNIFQPHKLGVTCISASLERVLLAVRRGYLIFKDINSPFSQIDFYDITSKSQPKYVHSIIEYEDITGLSWLDDKHIISVSMQATINIYNIKSGRKLKTVTTDYGPITSMKHSLKDNLLVTGTEYGYVAVYKVNPKERSIQFVEKMVKVTELIATVDFHIKPRKVPFRKPIQSVKPSQLLKHIKRKGSDSSDDSDDDDGANDASVVDKPELEFLEMSDLIIYGGYLDKLVAWDFHRTTILDTMVIGKEVCSILALTSGNVAVGDIAGCLSVVDNITFTCRQSEKLFDSAILTMAINPKNTCIIAAGNEPTIAILKIDKSSGIPDTYILREQLKDHSLPICCSLFTSKKEFFTASDDNVVIKFRQSRVDGIMQVKRFKMLPAYKSKLNFHDHEAMATFGKSMQIFKFSNDTLPVSEIPICRTLAEPQRICTIRASAYVHAATLDDKWICYATSSGVKIIDRPNLSRVDTTAYKLPACQIMKLCQSGRYLAVGQQKSLTIIELKNEPPEVEATKAFDDKSKNRTDESDDVMKPKVREYKSIFFSKLRGFIRSMVYYEFSNRLIVSCGTTSHSLYVIKLPTPDLPSGDSKTDKKNEVEILFKVGLQVPLSHIARDIYNANDSHLYIYTMRDQLIKCDTLSKTFRKDLVECLFKQERIKGLPKDIGIQGLVILSPSLCLIHDNIYIFKVDLEANEIVNSTKDYEGIITLDNSMFNKPHEIINVAMI